MTQQKKHLLLATIKKLTNKIALFFRKTPQCGVFFALWNCSWGNEMGNLDNLLHTLTSELRSRNITIATAESCTGGLIASFLTELPGSSVWFERGFVTYSNLAKHEMLGINKAVIEQYGAVSEVVAESMALGALQFSVAKVAVAVTGIAGPDGGSINKPVGTVCFAYAMRGKGVRSERQYFANASRQQIRILTCRHAFQGMISLLKDMC
jgi:nicotinamide-nucleotide amidase